ncbi:MAG: transglutaminase domain-containing protein [Planctomycetaceae bacterium]
MVFASNVRLNPATRDTSLVLSLTFVFCLALFAACTRREIAVPGRWTARLVALVILLGAAVAGWGTTRVLSTYEDDFERWLAAKGLAHQHEVRAGFSGTGRLSDITEWKLTNSEAVALRCVAGSAPGYLRGNALDTYEHGRWGEAEETLFEQPKQLPKQVTDRPGEWLHRLDLAFGEHSLPLPARENAIDIWPTVSTSTYLFCPYDTSHLSMTADTVLLGRNRRVYRSSASNDPYTVFRNPQVADDVLPPADLERLRRLPESVKLELLKYRGEVFGSARSATEKLQAVRQFLTTKFTYGLSAYRSRGRDPIEKFLEERPPGHCEYFASAAALLLRSVDVPTRYIAGYVATEHNPEGGYWVARHKDAHAWVEAYNDETGRWEVLECTPADGVPQPRQQEGMSGWLDGLTLRFNRWFTELTRAGFLGSINIILQSLFSPVGMLAVSAVAGLYLLWRWLRRRAVSRAGTPVFTPAALAQQLRMANRMARHHGLERRPHETLQQFARRLREASSQKPQAALLADWYDHYGQVRYGRVESADDYNDLDQQLRSIPRE